MTWQESAAQAVQRLVSRTGNPLFTRRQLIDSEIKQIVAETASAGETPDQTLSRVLQELRDQGVIKFESSGVYRLLKLVAKAYPRKNFFVQMFTKDISLEDCVLDLIDNSVDGFIRSRGLRLSRIASAIWQKEQEKVSVASLPLIDVKLSDNGFEIKDTCGGIDLNEAINETFNFGHPIGYDTDTLGVYGIGLKRALFKLGDRFEISSQTRKNGFNCTLPVKEWVEKDDSPEDWKIPLTEQRPASSINTAGTRIVVDQLHAEVKDRLRTGTVEAPLRRAIASTYCFFLERHVRVRLNDQLVEPMPIPTSKPRRGTVSYERFPDNGVDVRILATIAAQEEDGHYENSRAGWYIVCNGRAVLSADKTELTGWGSPGMPVFQPKHRAFVGVVFFESTKATALPWTTTKRSLNRESSIYIRTRNKMALAARPVLSFISRKYPSDVDATPAERGIAKSVVIAKPAEFVSQKGSSFFIPTPPPAPKLTQSVQYQAKISDLEKIRTHLRQLRMANWKIGEHTFNYFMEQEGLK